ncbi:MAG TPA: sodium:proton antiporter [Burkholderiaceae bacterium]|nr:sodium:proton antiporter [Burkholderiaceae bacterium]
MLEVAAACLVVTALLAYVNHRFVGLPTTIGVMVIALGLSLLLITLNAFGLAFRLREEAEALLTSIDFSMVLMQGMLSLLLFAGALHVNLGGLRTYRWQVGALAIFGTAASAAAVAMLLWFLLPFAGVPLTLSACLLFGALISPTDPIAVMGILKSAGAPHNLELVIAGESLFNDGVGLVIFLLVLGIATSGETPTFAQGAKMLMLEAGGGLVFGLALGYATFRLLRSVDQYQVEVMLTLAAVLGGYALAGHLHVSGPLAMVAAGLVIGNQGRDLAMSDTTRRHVDLFWELLDEILNAVLFVLIGLEVIVIHFPKGVAIAAVVAVPVVVLARWLTVGLPVELLRGAFRLPEGAGTVLTWGGLRGGISVALALSLPASRERDVLIALTYCVVVFSILGQGLTIGRAVRRFVHE